MKLFFKILLRAVLGILGLIVVAWVLLQTAAVQNFLIHKITAKLSKDLNTEVRIKHVNISFFNKLDMSGFYVQDLQKDTLLYAGDLKVRVTDWFFLKKNIDLTYIGLSNAVIKLNRRTDSLWNDQFIIDHFASKNPKPKAQKKKSAIHLDLEKVDLQNVRFEKDDRWGGEKMDVRIGNLLAETKQFDLTKSIFRLKYLYIDQPYFKVQGMHPLRPYPNPKKPSKYYFNKGDIDLEADTVSLQNGTFADFQPVKRKTYSYFDTHHLLLTQLNGQFSHFSFAQDTIQAKIRLSAKERSGFDLRNLSANFKLTPQKMEFKNLEIRSTKTLLRNYFCLHFHDFADDMGEIETNVRMVGVFKNSVLHTDDLAHFAPGVKSWHKKFGIIGNLDGIVRNFTIKGLSLKMDQHTILRGDLSMRGFPETDTAHIKVEHLDFQSESHELASLVTPLKDLHSPDLAQLGVFRYRGYFNGQPRNFETNGTLSSALGALYVDTHLQFPENDLTHYEGSARTDNFNLGRLIHSKSLGYLTFNGKFKGKGFYIENASSSLSGTFKQIDVNGYRYQNVAVDGNIKNKFFTGNLNISDPNINLVSNIQVDFNGSSPKFNILGDLVQARLQKLKLINKDFTVTGLFDLDFEGKNIDDYVGSAKLFNANLMEGSRSISFDSLTVNASRLANNEKRLEIESNEFDATVEGKYNIMDLPNSFQSFLHRYYPSLISAPSITPKNQRFLVSINTRNFDAYAPLFVSSFRGLDSAVLTGGINTIDSNYFYLHANIPFLKVNNIRILGSDLEGRGDLNQLTLNGNIGRVYTSDSAYFPSTLLNVSSQQDYSLVKISTRANKTLEHAELNAHVTTMSDGVKIDLLPSSFILNKKKWELEKEGEIIVRKAFASATNVKFTQDNQEIELQTVSKNPGQSDLDVQLRNVEIEDFLPMLVKNPVMEGRANGKVYMYNFFGDFNIVSDLQASQFKLNGDSVGLVHIKGDFVKKTGIINYDIKSDNPRYQFAMDGAYKTRDTTESPLLVNLRMGNARVFILNEFLNGIFSDISGQASGNLRITGDFSKPVIEGVAHLRDVSAFVNYTQVQYTVDTGTLYFDQNYIDLGELHLKDKFGNFAYASGRIYEHALENMRYDLHIQSDKFLALDTKAKDNPNFYGSAICKGKINITGPQADMHIGIEAEASDTSTIYIPTADSREAQNVDYIVYKNYGSQKEKNANTESDSRLTIDMDLKATPLARINVILDAQTGDVISAVGHGNLNIHVPADGNISMKGKYAIDKGNYNFSFQSFIKKPFTFNGDDNNYLEWNGSPYDANIHINATYVATQVSINDLISSQSGYAIGGNIRGYRGDVYVIAELTGKLAHPDINFNLDFPVGSTIKTDPDFNLFLKRIDQNPNEMLRQVTFLIVFGTFAPYGQGSGATNFASVGVNTISSLITSEANKALSDVLYKLTGDRSLKVDISTSTYSSNSWNGLNNNSSTAGKLDRQAVDVKLNKSLLNDKIILTFGSNFDFNLGNNSAIQNGNFQWLPNFSVQIILSKNRRLRGIIFNRSSLDVTSLSGNGLGRINRMGVSISYSKDFDRWFGTKPKKIKVQTDSTKVLRK